MVLSGAGSGSVLSVSLSGGTRKPIGSQPISQRPFSRPPSSSLPTSNRK
ncbi:hypothetical protein DFA_06213 [Cavenderia fasciculata]|uniref:Uncharacterized protein n=1 Tax=Cavenderia fasciculata TaxID=261658 RepID=F4PKF1_CACFS|nr:uncharacterized protein DFA_06213 [Cavenderia fasciculata]EGG24075.1 hypothetical protein DFA_06213 [Cavenderia fasciculata]|eukprot:XP_004361926.1 hypothetical protein DFA_06213 [Cavenderia fasciculata]